MCVTPLTSHFDMVGDFFLSFLSDGTSIYLTRDIGGAIERYEKYKFDKMLYVIASQQDLHVAQFIKVLELLQFPWAKNVEHVNYGLVLP